MLWSLKTLFNKFSVGLMDFDLFNLHLVLQKGVSCKVSEKQTADIFVV
jgi:hypothetical protein